MDVVEEWRTVVGYEGLYEVSNLGRVRSLDRIAYREDGTRLNFKGRMKKRTVAANGYYMMSITKDGHTKQVCVHALVANAFIPNPDNLPEVNHKDLNRLNSVAVNLEWVTRQGNIVHCRDNGRLHGYTNKNRRVKNTPESVRDMRESSARGESHTSIARRLGVSRRGVGHIVKKTSWNPEFEDKAAS